MTIRVIVSLLFFLFICSRSSAVVLRDSLLSATASVPASASSTHEQKPPAERSDDPSPVNWSNLTSTTLHALSPSSFLMATSLNLSTIPPSACTGFRADQLQALNRTNNQCEGVQPMCFQRIDPRVMYGLTAQCLSLLTPTVIASASPSQWSNTTAGIWLSINKFQVAALTNCSGFTEDMMMNFGNGLLVDDACTSFTASCMQTLPLTSINGITRPCVGWLDAKVLYGMVAAQISQLSPYSLAGMNESQLASFRSSACSGFTAQQTDAYQLRSGGFQPQCISQFTENAFSGLSSEFVEQLGPDAFVYINSTQFAVIDPYALTRMQDGTLRRLNPEACAGLTSNQLRSLQNSPGSRPCSALQIACAKQIPLDAMSGIDVDCISNMPAETFASFSTSQIFGISAESVSSGLTASQLGLMTSGCAGFHDAQLSFGDDQYGVCSNFTAACVSALDDSVFPYFTSWCVVNMPVAAVAALSSTQVSWLYPEALCGFSSEKFSVLHSQCSMLTPPQMSVLGSTCSLGTCAGMQKDCAQLLPLLTVSAISKSCLSGISNSTISGMSLAQLQLLDVSTLPGMTWPQFNELWLSNGVSMITEWNINQTNALSSGVMDNFTLAIDDGSITPVTEWNLATNLTSQSGLQLASCIDACMLTLFSLPNSTAQLPLLSWRGLRAGHVMALTIYGLSVASITSPDIWQMWSGNALRALTAAQVSEIPPSCINSVDLSSLSVDGITGLTTDQMARINNSTLSNLPCILFHALTSQQLVAFDTIYPFTYQHILTVCGALPPPPPTSPRGLDSLDSCLIALGCAILLGIVVWCCWRRHTKKSREKNMLDHALLQNS